MIYFIKILCIISFVFCEKETLAENTSNSKNEEDAEYIYIGNWPVNGEKNNINSLSSECPGGVGCECSLDSDCLNNNCAKQFKGKFCTLKEGNVFRIN